MIGSGQELSIAGAVAAWLGTGNAFLASAVLFIGMIFVVRRWKRQEQALPGVPETLFSGISSGVRFVRHSADSAPPAATILRPRWGLKQRRRQTLSTGCPTRDARCCAAGQRRSTPG
jgi:hypothetical protein